MKLRNISDFTVTDYTTQLTAAPDEVIDVDDSLREFYEDHAYWEELPDTGKKDN